MAATDRRDQLSGFSNYGLTTVDLGAPGTDILSTFPGNTYGTISGTSMATPHVSGAVSLLLAAAPTLTGLEAKAIIMQSVDVIPALQGRTVTGGRLNVYTMLAGLDDTPPDAVSDLAVQSTGSTTAVLAWTATGDDGAVGTASSYDLRYSTSPIDSTNFDSATPVPGTPAPKAAGGAESFEVSGLDYNTQYYFALVVADEQDNRSGVSNSPNGTTLGAPHLAYAPASFSADLLTGGTDTQTLTIQNTGEGTLDFSFPTGAMQSGPMAVSPSLLPSWLHANPPAGRVNAGESMEVHLVFNATGLYGGNYNETVMFATNDHTQESAPLYVSLHVTNAPDVATSPLELDYGVRFVGTCSNQDLVVRNVGTSALSVSGISVINPDFSVESDGLLARHRREPNPRRLLLPLVGEPVGVAALVPAAQQRHDQHRHQRSRPSDVQGQVVRRRRGPTGDLGQPALPLRGLVHRGQRDARALDFEQRRQRSHLLAGHRGPGQQCGAFAPGNRGPNAG